MELSVPNAVPLVSTRTMNQVIIVDYLLLCLSWMSTFVVTPELVCCVGNVDQDIFGQHVAYNISCTNVAELFNIYTLGNMLPASGVIRFQQHVSQKLPSVWGL